MGIAYHTTYSPDGAGLNLFDRAIVGTVTAVYGAVTSGGTAVVAVTWSEPIPTPYWAGEAKIESSSSIITNKTSTGFTLTITPSPSTSTLAGGSIEILLVS